MVKWIGAAKTNFKPGRQIYKPKAIVIHIMGGSLAGTDTWFNNPAAMVSAHYGIGKNGEIHQYVKEEDTAFHTGKLNNPTWTGLIKGVNPNLYTLGIEHEGQPSVLWTSAMEDASTKLVYDLCKKYDIPIDADHIIRHHEIYDLHNCPGPCWDKQTYIDKVKSYGA